MGARLFLCASGGAAGEGTPGGVCRRGHPSVRACWDEPEMPRDEPEMPCSGAAAGGQCAGPARGRTPGFSRTGPGDTAVP